MDINGLPLWTIAGADQLGVGSGSAPGRTRNLGWNAERQHLTLAAQQSRPELNENEAFARLRISAPSPVADPADTFAWWSVANSQIEASGFAADAVAIHLGSDNKPETPPPSLVPTDMAMGEDQLLYIARDGAVLLRDMRDRYPTAIAKAAGFSAELLAPRPAGGAWTFDRARRQLAVVSGYALRPIGLGNIDPGRFEPVDPNPDPPRIEPVTKARLPQGFEAVALATSPRGKLALLAWQTGGDAAIFALEGGKFVLRGRTAGIRFPWSIAWVKEEAVAIMASDGAAIAATAFVYSVSLPADGRDMLPDGRIFVLRSAWIGGFCNRIGADPVYLASPDANHRPTVARRLIALSGARYARTGTVLIGPIDSGQEGCVWHRLYAEASVPQHSQIKAGFFASDGPAQPSLPDSDSGPLWAQHRIGGFSASDDRTITTASWCDEPSELPAHPGLLRCPRRIGESGLFNLLIQHNDRKVRRVSGRYAWILLTLEGDSRDTPELAALRLYAHRFSYRDRYLPDFYSESLTGIDAEAVGAASGPDFLDRTLALFEGSLTELEGKIAGSWLYTDPAGAPDAALPWIGSWIGIDSPHGGNADRLRQQLVAAPFTAKLHGTLGGLLAALELGTGGRCIVGGTIDAAAPPEAYGSLVIARLGDRAIRALLLGRDTDGRLVIAAGGSVTRGDIVVVEGFRMRRTFATILGADLADENDPLTLGMATSGNSYVGDTLILGDRATTELLALYRPEITNAQNEVDGIAQFFERLAYRTLVLARGITETAEFKRLDDIIAETVPAHIEPQLFAARTPLIVGAASLVGIDTYLGPTPITERVRLNQTIVGEGDLVRGEGWLDGRADGPMALAPTARGKGPGTAWTGAPFMLSALGSSAAKGRNISRYIWTWEG